MNKINTQKVLLSFLFIPLANFASAEEVKGAPKFISPYEHRKNQVLRTMDECELIGAERLMRLNAFTVAELKKQLPELRKFITETRNSRAKCYASALTKLEGLLQEGFAVLSKDERNTIFQRQQEIDESLKPMLSLRHSINDQLLISTLQDIELAIKSMKDVEEGSSTFYEESSRTRSLVREDISLVMETLRRQMALDELKLMNDNLVLPEFAPHKINEVQFYLSQALSAFEEAYSHEHPAFVIARIKAKVSFASELLNELVTYLVPMKNTAKADIKVVSRLYNEARAIHNNISRTLGDLNAGIYSGDLQNWLGALYQNINNLTNQTQDVYAEYLKSRQQWRAMEAERLFKDEQKAIELSKQAEKVVSPIPEPWIEDMTEVTQTIDMPKRNHIQEAPIISVIPQVEVEDLMPSTTPTLQKIDTNTSKFDTEAQNVKENKKDKEKPKRLTPELSFTDLLKRKIEEEKRLKKAKVGEL